MSKITKESAQDFTGTLYSFVKIDIKSNKMQEQAKQWEKLFLRYSAETVKIGFELLKEECELPTDKFSGRLPKIATARKIFYDCQPKYSHEKQTDRIKQGSCPPNIFSCVMNALSGKGWTSGTWQRLGPPDFNLKEFYIKLIEAHKKDQLSMCPELVRIESDYIDLGVKRN